MKRTLVGLFAVAFASCATMKSDLTVCPEYRGLRCMTAVECSMNAARGCQVCQCSPAGPTSPGPMSPGPAPTGIPPDRRFP